MFLVDARIVMTLWCAIVNNTYELYWFVYPIYLGYFVAVGSGKDHLFDLTDTSREGNIRT